MIVAGAPITAADILALQALTTGKPLCRLIQQASQSLASGTATVLTFGAGSEDVDTHGFHDTATNTGRITPTVAGWYRFAGTYFTASIATPTSRTVTFRKNGTTSPAPAARDTGSPASTTAASLSISALILMNGVGDYLELLATQASAGAVSTSVSTQLTSAFECEFVRPQ